MIMVTLVQYRYIHIAFTSPLSISCAQGRFYYIMRYTVLQTAYHTALDGLYVNCNWLQITL